MRISSLLVLVVLAACLLPVSAHEGGHGPTIAGQGKHGGQLASVIDAAEAELGPEARPVYLAELVIPSAAVARTRGRALELKLYDLARREIRGSDLSSTSKVILLPKGNNKPHVFAIPRGPATLADSFKGHAPADAPSLDELNAMEFIFSQGQRKYVVTFQRGDQASK